MSRKVRISELPPASDYTGLVTIGTDRNNVSVKVALDTFLNTVTQNATGAVQNVIANNQSATNRPRLPNYCENFPTLWRQPFFGYNDEHQHFTDRQF